MDSGRELRTEFVRALDAVAPPAPWLKTTVRTRLREERGVGHPSSARRTGRSRLMVTRRAGAFVAVLALVLLVVTLLAGGYIWQDWQRFQKTQPVPAGRSSEAELRARPVILPVVAPDAECPSTPRSSIDYGIGPITAYGSGPVYGLGGLATPSDWGTYFDVTYLADPNYTGLVLIRIRDLQSERHAVFVGPYAAGDVVGTDAVEGKSVEQHAEALLDASRPQERSSKKKWGVWHIRQGMSSGWSHCLGIQADGEGFTEVVTGLG